MSDGALTKAGTWVHDNGVPSPTSTSVFDLFSLHGKTAIVTGAAAGIGLSAAEALAEVGANVAITYNTNTKAPERATEIARKFNVKCKAYQLDVASAEAVLGTVDEIVSEFNGRLDVFIANAGIPWTQGAALGGEISHYQKVVKVDLDGTYYSALAAGKHFRRQFLDKTDLRGNKLEESYSGGSFVATASISGHIVNIPQLQAAYNAAKAGVAHLCKSLAIEWIRFARVNSISPGYIATEISAFIPDDMKGVWRDKVPMGREASPNELKCAFLYFATPASSYTTGSDLIIDGGYTVG
ncbi:hypothetical protein EDD36DRAFT_453400 [Exophiala viscosa]|uniref:L-xylulose reductase n=1 Tax=Exophiala viscosa TaxID=2486360 RepID=A0AAN6DSG3_9EURO|nr:hypothetical protein EDD36DRAFT_453400 [Exophiala viscosa]